jgi:hypothetical protein
VIIGIPQLSVAEAVPVAEGSVGSSQLRVTDTGQLITGFVISWIIINWLH